MDVECFHCGLKVEEDGEVRAEVDGAERTFCCIGCRSVCEAIHAAGLEGFYQRTPDGTLLAPPPDLPSGLELYDMDEVQEEFVASLGDEREVHLLVEGIHCAACVWLIENALRGLPGVIEARVNLTGKKLLVKWDNGRVSLSRIIARVGSVGYKAVPFDPESAEGVMQRANRELLYRMGFAAFAMMNLLWISIALYTGANEGEYRNLFHWIGFALATPTLIYSGAPFYRGAWSGLRNMRPGMDLPIAIGASITYLYSLYVTVTGVGEVYWDTVVNFLFVILVGRYLEAISKRQAVASTQRLLDLQPKVATRVEGDTEKVAPIRSIKKGEQVLVRPGERIPVDGVILQGGGEVNEAMLTGESRPVVKAPGDSVAAGTMNSHGMLRIEVTGVLKESALGRIIRLVEDAQASKAPIQCIADRIVPWFVSITILLAILTFIWWMQEDFAKALMAATAVLIITCPCAFGMATPMSIAVASGLGARYGVLVKNGAVLETLSDIGHVVFDKTGTLTEGKMTPTVIRGDGVDWRGGEGGDDPRISALLADAIALERYSEHPIGRALVEFADQRGWSRPRQRIEAFEYRPGFGVFGRVGGREIAVGTAAWMEQLGYPASEALMDEGEALSRKGVTPLFCASEGRVVALVGVEDRIRDGAPELLERLRARGMRLTLLSGDRRAVAEAIAERLGGMEVIAEVLPEEKDRVIGELQAGGCKVAMVGDGVNDAPALVRADVGIAMGGGTDVSIASADVVLMSGELEKVHLGIALSARTLRTIRQNIGISITYNLIMVPLAMMALITPLVAAVSMPISSLAVIANAARIRTLFRGSERRANF